MVDRLHYLSEELCPLKILRWMNAFCWCQEHLAVSLSLSTILHNLKQIIFHQKQTNPIYKDSMTSQFISQSNPNMRDQVWLLQRIYKFRHLKQCDASHSQRAHSANFTIWRDRLLLFISQQLRYQLLSWIWLGRFPALNLHYCSDYWLFRTAYINRLLSLKENPQGWR